MQPTLVLEKVAIALGLAGFFYGAAIIALQVLAWLRFGQWQPVPITEMCRPAYPTGDAWVLMLVPRFKCGENFAGSWEGVQQILDWLGSMNLGMGVWLVTFILVSLLVRIAEDAEGAHTRKEL